MSNECVCECTHCGYKGKDAIWVIDYMAAGNKEVKEKFKVTSDAIDPEYYNLDIINHVFLMDKYKISRVEAEEAILNGYPICPRCMSENYYKVQ